MLNMTIRSTINIHSSCESCVRVNDEARDDVNCRKSKLPTKNKNNNNNQLENKQGKMQQQLHHTTSTPEKYDENITQ